MNWQDFLQQAKTIVSAYRDEAPEGFDPQNTWIAVGVGGAMLIGGTVMGADAAHDRKGALGKIARTPNTDWRATQGNVVDQNLKELPALSELAGGVNTANQDQRLEMLNRAIPGYGSMMSSANTQLSDLLAGRIPQSDSDAVMRNAAAKSLAGGFAGSGMHGDLALRDLGLSSFDATKLGLNLLPGFMTTEANLGMTPQFDLTTMFMNPGSITDLLSRERAQNMNAAMGAANAPTSGEVWGNALQQTGSSLMGGGITAGLGGMGGGMGGGSMAKTFGAGSEMDLMQRYGSV